MNSSLARLLALCAVLFAALCSGASAASLDVNFGHDGRVAVELGIFGSRANAVAVQPDGKIVAAGYASSTADRDFMLFRLLPDGTLDPDFNYDGTVTTAVGSYDDEALTLAVQPDGKIIAAGYISNGENRDFALVRYNGDGSLDRSFGTEGMAVTAVGGSHDEITGIAVQEDGGIVIAGAAQDADGKVAVLARYLPDGSPDPHFADEGFSLSAVGVDAQTEGVALGKDGRILLSGSYSDGKRRGLMLLGFDSAGKLDKTFGENGIAVPADSSVFSEGYGMFVNEDGSILVAGSVGADGKRDAALFRFTADGSPDSSFEKNGVLVTAAGSGDDVLHGVVVLDDGTIAAAGFKAEGEQREFLLITYSKNTGAAEENSGSLTMQTAGLTASAIVTTGFGGDKDTSTALAAVTGQSVVAVGESEAAAGSSAAVSKYTLPAADSGAAAGSSDLDTGNEYVWTGAPYEVTRTTAILPGEIKSGLGGTVSKRGIVFSTMPNPSLKDGSSSSGDGSGVPVVTNNSTTSVTGASATLSLTTDVNATCKYDTTAGTAYDDMESTFSTTGAKTHSHVVSDLEAEKTYSYYARCKNTSSGALNTADTVISFTVKTGSDSTDSGPVRSNLLPSGTISSTSATLKLTTDVDAKCKYDTTAGTAYDDMESNFSTTGTKTHSQSVTGLQDGDEKKYYVRCKNTSSDAVNTTDGVISFTVKIGNDSTTDTTPPSVTETTKATFSIDESVSLSVRTNEKATCRYNEAEDAAYDDMTEEFPGSTDGKIHSADLGQLSEESYTYYVCCEDDAGNVNSSGKKISFEVTSTLPPPPAASRTSDQLINTALRNVGSFFVGTAVAQTSTTNTTDTSSTATADATTNTSTNAATTSTNSTDSKTKFLEEGSTSEGSGTGMFSSKLTNLKPGTFFYARAYAVIDGTTYYGNQVGFRTADSCFVATAAFGSVFHPAVQVLRDFRNQFLSGNAVSRAAVDLYYQVSPALADLISQHSGLRTAVRLLLLPVTGAAWLLLQFGIWTLLLSAAGGGGLVWIWRKIQTPSAEPAA